MFRRETNNIDNYSNLSEEEKIDYLIIVELKRIIVEEYEKAEHEQDIDLINECYDTLYDKTGIRINYSDDEIRQNVSKAMERADAIKSEKARKAKRISRLRLTACIAVVMLLATQFVAMVLGYNPIVEIYELLKSNEETHTIAEEGITYTYYGEAKLYGTIDELVEQEELNILYPIQLPDGVEITEIHNYYMDEYRRINIIFDTENLLFQINEYHNIDIKNLSDYEIVYINEIEFYIIKRTTEYEAIFYYDKYEYSIKCTEYNLLTEIIESIGE